MTHELELMLQASGIKWAALRNHIPCLAHIIQLAIGAFISTLGVQGHTKSRESRDHNHQFGVNVSRNSGKCQSVQKEGNAGIDKV